MSEISQTFANLFNWGQIIVFRFQFHLSEFITVRITIGHDWLRQWQLLSSNEPMMIQFIDVCICHETSVNWAKMWDEMEIVYHWLRKTVKNQYRWSRMRTFVLLFDELRDPIKMSIYTWIDLHMLTCTYGFVSVIVHLAVNLTHACILYLNFTVVWHQLHNSIWCKMMAFEDIMLHIWYIHYY